MEPNRLRAASRMSRLEWALGSGEAPEEWRLLETGDRKIQGPLGIWFPKHFIAWDDDQYRALHCYFDEWSAQRQGVAVFFTEASHPEFGVGVPVGTAVVRQVPTCLVFTCQLTLLQETCSFEAVVATLSGKNVMRLEESLPSVLTMEHINISIAETAEAIGVLLSVNQEVHVLLNGSCTELPDEAILWCEQAPVGWLQRG